MSSGRERVENTRSFQGAPQGIDASPEEWAVSKCRQEVADLIAAHLDKHNDDWTTLPVILKHIASTYSIKQLFSPDQQNSTSFLAEEKCVEKRMTRDAVGKSDGRFHLVFFALAKGFRGCPHHHHANVNCVSAVLEGLLTEITYKESKNGDVTAMAVEMREKGSVTLDLASTGDDKYIHGMGNYHQEKIVYSVHVYSVPKGVDFNVYYDSVTNPLFVEREAERQVASYDAVGSVPARRTG